MILLIAIVGAALVYWTSQKMPGAALMDIPANITPYRTMIERASTISGVPSAIIASVIMQESSGNPNAVGSDYEVGLMQLKQIAITDLIQNGFDVPGYPAIDPLTNIIQGSYFLTLQFRRAGNWYDALRAYNGGYAGTKDNPQVSKNYADSVLQRAKRYGY
jgi:soluble lytic murein transglycosylase-like protein